MKPLIIPKLSSRWSRSKKFQSMKATNHWLLKACHMILEVFKDIQLTTPGARFLCIKHFSDTRIRTFGRSNQFRIWREYNTSQTFCQLLLKSFIRLGKETVLILMIFKFLFLPIIIEKRQRCQKSFPIIWEWKWGNRCERDSNPNKSRWPSTGLQCSEEIQHPEVGLNKYINA